MLPKTCHCERSSSFVVGLDADRFRVNPDKRKADEVEPALAEKPERRRNSQRCHRSPQNQPAWIA